MNTLYDSNLAQVLSHAQSMSTQGYRIGLFAQAAALDGGGTEPAAQAQALIALRDASIAFSAAQREVRNCDRSLLRDADPGVVKIIRAVFDRQTDATLTCFAEMLRDLERVIAADGTVSAGVAGELVRFITNDLHQVTGRIVNACVLAFEIGQKESAQLAFTDELTGLPNRRAMQEIARNVVEAIKSGRLVSVMHIDLDRFKILNDTLGHAAGDTALRHAGKTIQRHVREEDFAARIGGDEFALVMFDAPEAALATRANSIVADLSKPFHYNGKTCQIGGSVGVAISTELKKPTFESLLHNADLALYAAKNGGRGQHRFFTSELRTHQDHVDTLSDQMQTGMQRDEFEPFFQPQVDGRSGELVGFEALIRWHHPTRGLLLPFHFIQVAEEVDLLDALDEVVMNKAFRAMRGWLDRGLKVPRISINLSAGRLKDTQLVDTLKWAAERYELNPRCVSVEILESAMMEGNNGQMIANAVALSDAGFCVELDDFGTGHASIANLRHFKVDRIKIDKSFVKDLHLFSDLSKITSAMISLAHSLRIDVLAEGVETPEERLVLNALGCDHIQGFGVAKPMPVSEVADWVERTQNPRSLPPRRYVSPNCG